jgi:hypothetical protein
MIDWYWLGVGVCLGVLLMAYAFDEWWFGYSINRNIPLDDLYKATK